MKERPEMLSIFKPFFMGIKTQLNALLCIFQSDNACEYFHTSLSQFFDDHDIIHRSSCPHTPQQNSVFMQNASFIRGHVLLGTSYKTASI